MEENNSDILNGTVVRDYSSGECDLVFSHLKPVISADLEPIIGDLPDEQKEKILGVISSRIETSYSSPIPPPNLLRGYNEVIDSGAERLMQMAEKQLNHRLELETKVTRAQITESLRGQIFGLSVAVVGLVLASYLAVNGHETLGGIFGTTTIIGLVTVFVIGKKKET